jgi:hypothetical protein
MKKSQSNCASSLLVVFFNKSAINQLKLQKQKDQQAAMWISLPTQIKNIRKQLNYNSIPLIEINI